MKIYRLEVSLRAQSDLQEIQLYIALDSPGRATAFTAQILNRIGTLERFPRRYSLARDATSLGENLRAMVVAPYKIYYTIAGDVVHILHVRHTARGSPDLE
jgi:plasmid stabilization system protein ParE